MGWQIVPSTFQTSGLGSQDDAAEVLLFCPELGRLTVPGLELSTAPLLAQAASCSSSFLMGTTRWALYLQLAIGLALLGFFLLHNARWY